MKTDLPTVLMDETKLEDTDRNNPQKAKDVNMAGVLTQGRIIAAQVMWGGGVIKNFRWY